MKRHADYKDSGQSWVGEIPSHWELKPNRSLFRDVGKTVENEGDGVLLLSLTQRGLIPRDMENPSGKFPSDFSTYQKVAKGDLVFCLFDVDETPRTVGISSHDGMITGAYTVMRCYDNRNAKYLYWFYLSLDEAKRLKPLYRGLRKVVPSETFRSIKSPVPPTAEAEKICEFIEAQVLKMNTAITSQERMIDLLKERRSAIITQAVTKGLEPKAKMKDSGVPWIGKVPAHWPIVRVGSQTSLRSEKGSDKDFAPLSVTKLGVVPQLETAAKTDDGDNRKVVRKGDFVINGRSDRKGSSGVSEMDGSVSLINITIKLGAGLYPRFAHHLFRSYAFQEEFYRWGKGIVADLWSTNYWDMKRILCAMPTLEEQEAIAKFLDAELLEMDAAIKSQGRMIELLKERRSAIITQAVTGQIDVR